jgi:hypothetical protein
MTLQKAISIIYMLLDALRYTTNPRASAVDGIGDS